MQPFLSWLYDTYELKWMTHSQWESEINVWIKMCHVISAIHISYIHNPCNELYIKEWHSTESKRLLFNWQIFILVLITRVFFVVYLQILLYTWIITNRILSLFLSFQNKLSSHATIQFLGHDGVSLYRVYYSSVLYWSCCVFSSLWSLAYFSLCINYSISFVLSVGHFLFTVSCNVRKWTKKKWFENIISLKWECKIEQERERERIGCRDCMHSSRLISFNRD